MANALAHETSPYLLQHRDNPVDWLPWGEEALRRALEEDRPLLVSIGYSACHWCHVMERESFEDAGTAALMNERFVCVKVDREERPDVDAIYMEAVQAMTGHGGWPLNVFITPEQIPFFGGTYFPPEPRMGMPSWQQVLGAVADAWEGRREEIREQGARMAQRLQGGALLAPSEEPMDAASLDAAVAALRSSFDSVNGGWGGAPKFPAASVIEFLLRRGEPQMALYTLRSMASGGINDQVGGGFARYSVDPTWTVPHFEKMLYDNALLARAYVHGWQASGDALLRRTAEETLEWALREMRAPEGGFYSALDADSEGVEGKFYVWALEELEEVLGDDAPAAIEWFGATRRGNFEGTNVLESRGAEPEPEVRARIRARLLQAREQRVRPGLDDKRLASWNALMISALADAGAVLGRPDLLDAARAAAAFVLERMRDRRRAPAAHVQQRRGAPERIPRGPRVPARGPADALRGDLRGALVHRGAGAGRHDRRPVRRSRQRRLLLDLGRPRGARRPPQGPRGRPDPVRRVGRRLRPAAPRCAHRRSLLRGARAEPPAPPARDRPAAPGGLRPPAAGARLPPLPHARGRAGRRSGGRRRARGRRPRAAAPAPRARRRARRRRRAADGGPRRGRGPRRRLRLRALRVPAPGHRRRRAARPAGGGR